MPSPDGKRILLATPRGYCAGVDRAVDAVEKALELYGAPVYVRKEIVHNKYVVETLTKRGAIFVSETDEVPEGARVVFSAHGVSPQVHREAAARHLQTIDATCPLVTKVHKQAVRYADDDYDILLIGHTGHEEVEGTQGEAPDHIQVVNGPDEVGAVEVRDPDKVVWISQTTLSVDETMRTVELLRERFPHLIDPPSDDICYATQNRQGAVKAMAAKCDVVIVVGSANSSNSVRLVEVALEAGAGAAYRVDHAEEVLPEWMEGATTVGLTSGASVPEILVRDVVENLGGLGYTEVDLVTTASEDIRFSLPKNLRADLKAVGAHPDRPHKVREVRAGVSQVGAPEAGAPGVGVGEAIGVAPENVAGAHDGDSPQARASEASAATSVQ
ncbi:4-hydroxy-3-methylbut-2-enyl diphosphate reductase [Changpingibacter yushuensis]|uniref:4-hydroxy-3-methylbut-2-enyl diphosphate reductase n=1 Tax=Changpingibacter yushuensis TaxID=2758440 RepID=UPI0015F6D553|nr:4-hydroxy-3-methylbut-2-enyl diphosphate reductase [Changpingibacter yushuensis]